MASRSTVKLLAVVVMAAACDQGARSVPAPVPRRQPSTQPSREPAAARVQQTRAPRTLPNGRPACGNVGGKAPLPPECK